MRHLCFEQTFVSLCRRAYNWRGTVAGVIESYMCRGVSTLVTCNYISGGEVDTFWINFVT